MQHIKPRAVAVAVTKDKSTVIVKVVYEHEAFLLEHLFGESALEHLDEHAVAKAGIEVVQLEEPISAINEYARLERFYGVGASGKSVAEEVFGARAGPMFIEAAGGAVSRNVGKAA